MKRLPSDFYIQEDVVSLAKQLLGKKIFTNFNNTLTGGIIVETESYKGKEDRASHAYNNRYTKRTEVMYEEGGIAYVYLCYGIHHLFNVVTYKKGEPHAILIRAIEPTVGIETMLKRRNKKNLTFSLTAGPGALTQALGITKEHNGLSLQSDLLWIEDNPTTILPKNILASSRVGVSYAKEDALFPWRFRIFKNPWTSLSK